MPEVTYTAVTWTAGDTITEAKMDNMVANDRAVDAMNNGVEFTERADPSTPAANRLHIYAKDKSGVSALYMINDAGTIIELGADTSTFQLAVTGALATGTNQTPAIIIPRTLTITKAYAYVKTAPTGASLIIDINKDGTSIWNSTQANRLTVAAAAQTDTETSFDTTSLVEGSIITLDIDQVGSTVSGSDLTVALKCS